MHWLVGHHMLELLKEGPMAQDLIPRAELPGGDQGPTTPVRESDVRDFFDGLAALGRTIELGAPASVAVSISPSLAALVRQFCGRDPRYGRVMRNVWVRDYLEIKGIQRACDKTEAQPPVS